MARPCGSRSTSVRAPVACAVRLPDGAPSGKRRLRDELPTDEERA